MSAELLIYNGKKIFTPVVEEGVEWSTERVGSPGKLIFKVHQDSKLNIAEGNLVKFKWEKNNIFCGFIFSKKVDKDKIITITAYDQLRYLKNKETYVYENKTAGEIIKMICDDFRMQTGSIEDTKYKIASRVEDGQTLFDIIYNALDVTLTNTNNLYVMYDNFGKVALKSTVNMIVNILIDEETGQNFDYTSSIDENTYNKVKLIYDNEDTGQRDVYIAQDSNNMNNWGVLQYYDTLSKADALLKLYNQTTRKLNISGVFGDCRVRAGSMIGVIMDLGDVKLKNYMMVETCKHIFKLNEHVMDLRLRGGEFIG